MPQTSGFGGLVKGSGFGHQGFGAAIWTLLSISKIQPLCSVETSSTSTRCDRSLWPGSLGLWRLGLRVVSDLCIEAPRVSFFSRKALRLHGDGSGPSLRSRARDPLKGPPDITTFLTIMADALRGDEPKGPNNSKPNFSQHANWMPVHNARLISSSLL